MSDFIAGAVAVVLAMQTVGYCVLVGHNSVTIRRLRRASEELVKVRVALRAMSGDDDATGEAGGSK